MVDSVLSSPLALIPGCDRPRPDREKERRLLLFATARILGSADQHLAQRRLAVTAVSIRVWAVSILGRPMLLAVGQFELALGDGWVVAAD